MFLLLGGLGLLVVVLLYFRHVERGLNAFPAEVQALAPHRFTDDEIKQTYNSISKTPIDFTPHLPPKLDRRYVIVGGSGLVGGSIILHLLARGQRPESIRNIDFRKPLRGDLLHGAATEIGFAQADITNSESIRAVFNKPWPSSVANLPLTVFHTAAVIRPQDRARILYSLVSRVNVVGCANTIAAAKAAGASVFISTSSGSISLRPLDIWIPPWRKHPKMLVQPYPDPDKDNNIRPHGQYFGNYAESKAHGEKLTLSANTKDFRTGCIRPACGVYGNMCDLTLWQYMKAGTVPTWVPHIVNSFVHAENVSLAHLLHERAILRSPEKTSGRAYTVTDPGQAVTFGDIYNLLTVLTGFRVIVTPHLPILFIAHLIEAYTLTRAYLPWLQVVLPEIIGDVRQLQPSLFNISGPHQVASNEQASLAPEKGGIGYKGVCTSIEGMCWEAKMWNDEIGRTKQPDGEIDTIVKGIKNVGEVAAAHKA
ncbi:NAD(P)-binding protein [Microthyrium microscopicum]|uniref:NAD(P)-binding protein n=1 Tax=Microthyrium microscopicum TaxID=703497 RepID=A0A6A6U7G4_9PEZI|nr:NAD(P)-binding protein [Microthyrium microscopicum]